jgi:hypothetical protein
LTGNAIDEGFIFSKEDVFFADLPWPNTIDGLVVLNYAFGNHPNEDTIDAKDYPCAIRIWTEIGKTPKEFHRAQLDVLQYPETLQHFESAGLVEWQKDVVSEYRNHRDLRLNVSERHVVGNAVMSVGTSLEVREFLPFVLSVMNRLDESRDVISRAIAVDSTIPREVLDTLVLARWTDLRSWKKPTIQYQDSRANLLMDVIGALKQVKTALVQ